MSLINDVKKALRDTGIEMDADDIADLLSLQPRYRRRITRTQTAHALQALRASDPSVIRTRPGLYQHLQVVTSAPPPAHAVHASQPAPSFSRSRPAPTQTRPTSPPPILLAAERPYVLDRLASLLSASPSQIRIDALCSYLCELAERRLARPAQFAWHHTATAAAAGLTRDQYHRRDIVVLASPDVVGEAARTARRLGRPVRIWTLGCKPDDPLTPTGPEITETLPIDTDELRRCCGPSTTSPDPTQPASPATRSAGDRQAPARPLALDSLWHLDDTLYRRPIDGITGRGNTHALKRQALLVGSTYARRWSQVVTDATREHLATLDEGLNVPGRLYGDLLTFAEFHGLPLHSSYLIKDHLRRGFWEATRDEYRPHLHPGHAA